MSGARINLAGRSHGIEEAGFAAPKIYEGAPVPGKAALELIVVVVIEKLLVVDIACLQAIQIPNTKLVKKARCSHNDSFRRIY